MFSAANNDNKAALAFGYNGLDDRVSQIRGAVTTRYVYDADGRLIGEYGASATDVKAEYIWLSPEVANDNIWGGGDGVGGYAPLAISSAPTGGTASISWVHANHIGAPLLTTNASGTAITPTGYTQIAFPGQLRTLPDLYYNRYRDYDPTTGRYVQADPIGLDGDANPYAYAMNNPLRYMDPEGLETIYGFPHSQPWNKSAEREAYKKLPPAVKDNYIHIYGHGSYDRMCHGNKCMEIPEFVEWLTQRDEFRRNSGKGVVLWGCRTGMAYNGFAQRLANRLKRSVIAPDNYTWWSDPGGYRGIGPKAKGTGRRDQSSSGRLNEFRPKK